VLGLVGLVVPFLDAQALERGEFLGHKVLNPPIQHMLGHFLAFARRRRSGWFRGRRWFYDTQLAWHHTSLGQTPVGLALERLESLDMFHIYGGKCACACAYACACVCVCNGLMVVEFQKDNIMISHTLWLPMAL